MMGPHTIPYTQSELYAILSSYFSVPVSSWFIARVWSIEMSWDRSQALATKILHNIRQLRFFDSWPYGPRRCLKFKKGHSCYAGSIPSPLRYRVNQSIIRHLYQIHFICHNSHTKISWMIFIWKTSVKQCIMQIYVADKQFCDLFVYHQESEDFWVNFLMSKE
jgi:hypothetical protein